LSETNLAESEGGQEQETGIQVDLDASSDKDAVIRTKPRTARPPKNWGEERADTSAAVKKRLERMANRLTAQFDQRLAEQEAAHKRQLAEVQEAVRGMNRGDDTPTGDEAKHQQAMDKLQADLEEAQERGDSKAVARLTREMSSLDARFWTVQERKKSQTETKTQPAGNGEPAKKPTAAGVAWAKANGDWWNDTLDEAACDARDYANTLHKRMLAEGDDPEDPTYFERIGKMVAKRFPEIEVKSVGKRRAGPEDDDDDAEDDGAHRNPRRAAPPQLPNRGDAGRRQNLQTLSRSDIATMRQVGLDPDKNAHVVQFLRSKQETEADA
jgi:hypothetical protein